MPFNGFMTSSVCVHKIMEHADDVSKLVGWSNVTLGRVSHYFLLSFTMTTEYFSHHLKLVNARNTMSRLCSGLCIDWEQVDLISTNPTKASNSLPFKTLQHGF